MNWNAIIRQKAMELDRQLDEQVAEFFSIDADLREQLGEPARPIEVEYTLAPPGAGTA